MASGTGWRSKPGAFASGVFGAVFSAALAGSVLSALVLGRAGGLSWGQGISVVLIVGACSVVLTWLVVRASNQRFRRFSDRAESRASAFEDEKRRLKAVVDGMSDGVLVADAGGRTSFVNPRWRSLFGLADESEAGVALGQEPSSALDRMVAMTLESGQEQQLELELSGPDRRTLILTSSLLSEERGLVLVAQDVTELLRLTEVRQDFVANVSHELKTPLSAIRGFAETLLDGAKDDPQASGEFLERILRQCRRLEVLLSDLLTLSQMEHVATEGRMSPVDLEGIVHEAVEVVSDRIADKKLNLEVEIGALDAFTGDAVALERLCVNLLDNAVKYNREGGSIRVRLEGTGRDVILEVADTGIGIPKGEERRLFERFYRVDKGRSRQEGGTGLGLAIVKHAANLHGGSVEVESELGEGSLFRVRLPAV